MTVVKSNIETVVVVVVVVVVGDVFVVGFGVVIGTLRDVVVVVDKTVGLAPSTFSVTRIGFLFVLSSGDKSLVPEALLFMRRSSATF